MKRLFMVMAIASAALAGPMAADVKCSGNDCGVSIDGTGVSEYTGTISQVGSYQFNLAQQRSKDDTRYRCGINACDQCGDGEWESASIYNNDIEWGKSWDPDIEVAVQEENGKKYWLVYSHAMCMCRRSDGEPMARGGRVELTATQKVMKFLSDGGLFGFAKRRLFGG